MTDETVLQRLRAGGRMAGAVYIGLFGLLFGLSLIGFAVYAAIGFLAEWPGPQAALIVAAVLMPMALLGGIVAFFMLRIPITLWRDRRTPLPPIGPPIIIERKRPRRLWRVLVYGIGGATTLVSIASTMRTLPFPLTAYVLVAVPALAGLIGLVRFCFPPRLYWEPILLDAEGIEDRSLGHGKIPWRDVLDVSFGALAAGNGTLLKLTEWPQRLPGVTAFDIGLMPLLDRFVQGKRYMIVRAHGLDMHHERLFRLIHAHWRHATRGPGSAITRSSR